MLNLRFPMADIQNLTPVSLEILYLSVRILGCRPQTESDGLHQIPSSDAQSSSAASIISIASGDLKPSITYWVALPYAVSLASSVEYQTLRSSKISHTRKRAYRHFLQSCEILETLGHTFVSAKMMARLSQDALKGASKSRGHTSRAREEYHPATGDAQPNSLADTASYSLNHSLSPNFAGSSTLHPNPLDDLYQANDEFGLGHDLCFSEIDNVFDGLDGNFDLSRVDTLFSTTLNPTVPLIPTEWMDF